MRYLFFFGFMLLSVGGSHFYFWRRLVHDTALPGPFRLLATLLLLLLALSLPASFLLSRSISFETARLLLYPIYIWMGLMLLLLTFLLATDLLRWGYQLVAWATGQAVPAAGRLLLGRAQALVVLAAALLIGGYSIFPALSAPRVRRLEIKLPGLHPSLDGTTIVQLTDLHLGALLDRAWLEGVVGQVNQLSPDLIAITGDLVDGKVDRLRRCVEPIAALRARLGVYFVTGNHEYYSGVHGWMQELPRLGVRLLRNQHDRIGGDRGFDLAGVDDFSSGGMGLPGHGPDLPRALAARDPARPLILLAHQPRAVLEASRLGVDLQLSGHTHGGQIWPWTYLVRLQQPAVAGLTRFGKTQLYVSDGTGFWGPPMRLGTRAEISLLTLRAAP